MITECMSTKHTAKVELGDPSMTQMPSLAEKTLSQESIYM